jgi:hypothetical protein
MKMSSIDTNINNYTISELLTILDLEYFDPEQVTEKTNFYINKILINKIQKKNELISY